MKENDSSTFEGRIEPRIMSRYARPIDFIKETNNPAEIPKRSQKKNSNGDDIASFYKQLISSNDNKKRKEENVEDQNKEMAIWCESCQCNVLQYDYQRHIKGTAHIFSSKDFVTPPNVLILNSKNIGYKMMETQGWKYEEGLGPTGEGRRHPIPTALKQDRLCIGHVETGKKVVTHTYREIEKKAIQKRRLERLRQKPSGKQIAKNAKRESEERKRLLSYMNRE